MSRYAHPFFDQIGNRPPEATAAALAPKHAWAKTKLGRIPPVRGNGVIQLDEILGAGTSAEFIGAGKMVFHAGGDSGIPGGSSEAEAVAEAMALDYHVNQSATNPAFLMHLGDVIYGPGKSDHYLDEFYRPYSGYPGKILAIPGNHDGELTSRDPDSLAAFLANFCTPLAVPAPAADAVRIPRETMTLPGAYWMLEAPFVRIIGLYSNFAENPGFLEGEAGDPSQLDWLKKTLNGLTGKTDKALVIATHHPPFSQSSHAGSQEMLGEIETICEAAKVYPDLFLSGHAHNYQRFLRKAQGKQTPFLVNGCLGHGAQAVKPPDGTETNGTTYVKAVECYGFLRITVSAAKILIQMVQVLSGGTQIVDECTVDLATHTVSEAGA